MQRLSLCIDIDGGVLHEEVKIRNGAREVISEFYNNHYNWYHIKAIILARLEREAS